MKNNIEIEIMNKESKAANESTNKSVDYIDGLRNLNNLKRIVENWHTDFIEQNNRLPIISVVSDSSDNGIKTSIIMS